MIRLIIVAITVIGFLILSIPILFIEWIIGKFSPHTKEISSLRLIQGVFKLILWEAGTKVTIIGEENVPKDTPVLYIGNHRSYFDIVLSYSRCPLRTGPFRSGPASARFVRLFGSALTHRAADQFRAPFRAGSGTFRTKIIANRIFYASHDNFMQKSGLTAF